MALISGSLHWTVLADNIQFACLNTITLCTLHTFAVSRGSGMVAAVAASDGGVTTDGYGAQEYRKIRGQTHAAATARPVAVIAAAPQSCYRRRREAVRPDDARRPILDGHTVNRTEAAAVATSHSAAVMSRAAAARGCSRYVAAAIVRAEDSTVPTGSSSALLSWYGCHKQGRLQLVLRKYSFFVFFSSLLRTFCWSPLANAFKKIST